MSEYTVRTHFVGLGMALKGKERYTTREEAQAYIDDIIANGRCDNVNAKYAQYSEEQGFTSLHSDFDFALEIIEHP